MSKVLRQFSLIDRAVNARHLNLPPIDNVRLPLQDQSSFDTLAQSAFGVADDDDSAENDFDEAATIDNDTTVGLTARRSISGDLGESEGSRVRFNLDYQGDEVDEKGTANGGFAADSNGLGSPSSGASSPLTTGRATPATEHTDKENCCELLSQFELRVFALDRQGRRLPNPVRLTLL